MKSKRTIRGHGGGKGSGGAGVNDAPDSLRSVSYATVTDLVGEGELGGLVRGGQSIFLNGVPLQNEDGSFNFSNVQWDYRLGTQAQTPFPFQDGVETPYPVGVLVRNSAPIVRTITNAEVNTVRVTLLTPALQNVTSSGIVGAIIDFAIDIQSNGGGFVTVLQSQFNGKSSSAYQKAFLLQLGGSPPWDIRVRRLTADDSSSVLSDLLTWDTYTEIINAKLSYPNSAMVRIRVDASQFTSIPARGYEMYGWIIKVPSNYDPVSRTYTGIWDGTFKMAWSNNPAWCFYYLLQHVRAGLGRYVGEDMIDKWALYKIGQYCDEQVPDGKGGYEPRFVIAAYLQNTEEAYTLLNNLASVFRGMIYWATGTVTVAQDAPTVETPQIFNNANVIGGTFQYSGSDLKVRHTVALVTWVDPTNYYAATVDYVPDDDGIAKYGINILNITAVGCRSQGQAHRLGRWALYSERFETETVTFTAALDSAFTRPGAVIQVMDKLRAGKRVGGRVVAATANTVTLDSPVDLLVGQTYTFSVVIGAKVDTKTVITPPGNGLRLLVFSSNFAIIPKQAAIWLLASDELQPQLFRVINIKEGAHDQKLQYTITALAHNASKYAAIEDNLEVQVPPISTLIARPPTPQNVTISESVYQQGGVELAQLTLSCDTVSGAVKYEWNYQINSENPVKEQTSVNGLDVAPVDAGFITLTVYAIGPSGRRSLPVTVTQVIYAAGEAPSNIQNFAANVISGQTQLSWDLVPDQTVQTGGHIEIRYNAIDTNWDTAQVLAILAGAATQVTVAQLPGNYLAKAENADGIYSPNAAIVGPGSTVGGSLAVTITPATLANTGAASLVSGGPLTAQVSGGQPPYSYQWNLLSGGPFALPTPNAAQTDVQATLATVGSSITGTIGVQVTDSTLPSPQVVNSAAITVTLYRTHSAGNFAWADKANTKVMTSQQRIGAFGSVSSANLSDYQYPMFGSPTVTEVQTFNPHTQVDAAVSTLLAQPNGVIAASEICRTVTVNKPDGSGTCSMTVSETALVPTQNRGLVQVKDLTTDDSIPWHSYAVSLSFGKAIMWAAIVSNTDVGVLDVLSLQLVNSDEPSKLPFFWLTNDVTDGFLGITSSDV